MHNGPSRSPRPRAVAGTRVVPLVIDEKRSSGWRPSAPTYTLRGRRAPVQASVKRVGLVTTGSEVYHGRIKDKFGPVIRKKFGQARLRGHGPDPDLSDDPSMTRDAIMAFIAEGADMVVVTGGMSVDPDDQTPTAIRATGRGGRHLRFTHLSRGHVHARGPQRRAHSGAAGLRHVLPGVHLRPGGAPPAGRGAGHREDIVSMGHGGFCATCDVCRYPICVLSANNVFKAALRLRHRAAPHNSEQQGGKLS